MKNVVKLVLGFAVLMVFLVNVTRGEVALAEALRLDEKLNESIWFKEGYSSSGIPYYTLEMGERSYGIKLTESNEMKLWEYTGGSYGNSINSVDCIELMEELVGSNINLPEWTQYTCNEEKEYVLGAYENVGLGTIKFIGKAKGAKKLFEMEVEGVSLYKSRSVNAGFDLYVITDSPFGSINVIGKYMAVINREKGEIFEMGKEFSGEVPPIVSNDGSIYYIGIDGNLYVSSNVKDMMIWEAGEEDEIVEMASDGNMSYLKLRHRGRNIYKFFTEFFSCEIGGICGEGENIVEVQLLDNLVGQYGNHRDKNGRILEFGSLALVTREQVDGKLVKELIRWQEKEAEHPPVFSTSRLLGTGISDEVVLRLNQQMQDSIQINLEQVVSVEGEWDSSKLNDIRRDTICGVSCHKESRLILSEIQKRDGGLDVDSVTVLNKKDGKGVPTHIYGQGGLKKGEKMPVIVYVHGGPDVHIDTELSHDTNMYDYFVQEGFLVAVPEPRGSSGYGKAHRMSLVGDWSGGHLDDVVAVAEYVKSLDGVDADNVYLMGFSFGGYTTLAMAVNAKYHDYFAGYIPMGLVSEMSSNLREAVRAGKMNPKATQDFYKAWESKVGFDTVTVNDIAKWDFSGGNNPLENMKRNVEISPIYHLDKISKPVMQVHGMNDTITYPSQAIKVQELSYLQGVPMSTIMIEHMEHGGIGSNVFRAVTELPLKFIRSIIEGRYEAKTHKEPKYIFDVAKFCEEKKVEANSEGAMVLWTGGVDVI